MSQSERPAERVYIVELTAKELSASIEAFNVADAVVDGRPPLKNGSPLQQFAGGEQFRHVNGPGSSAWKKFVAAEREHRDHPVRGGGSV